MSTHIPPPLPSTHTNTCLRRGTVAHAQPDKMHATPSSLLQQLLLLLLLSSAIPVSAVSNSSALDQLCPASVTIQESGERANISTVTVNSLVNDATNGTLVYVQPKEGFKGVTVIAEGPGWQVPSRATLAYCFRDGDWQWWGLYAWVKIIHTNSSDGDLVEIGLQTGECSSSCSTTGHFPGDVSVQLVAHGPSDWSNTDPGPHCNTAPIPPEYPRSWSFCIEPPSSNKTDTGTIVAAVSATALAISAVASVVIIVLVIGSMVAVRKRRRQAAAEAVVWRAEDGK